MIITFEETYLEELYTQGKANDKKHRFQPHIVDKYVHKGSGTLCYRQLNLKQRTSKFEFYGNLF